MKNKVIIASVIILLTVSVLIYYLSPRPLPPAKEPIPLPSTPTPTIIVSYQGQIFPGKSSSTDLAKLKGEPANKTTFNNQTIYNYQATAPNWFNQFYVQDNLIKLIIEPIFPGDQRDKSTLIKSYGVPTLTLYGDLSDAGKDLFVYPSLGVAMLASNYTDILYEIWYFEPTTNDAFIKDLATPHGYSTIPPTPGE